MYSDQPQHRNHWQLKWITDHLTVLRRSAGKPSRGCYFDMNHPPKHCCRPLHGISIPRCHAGVSLCRIMRPAALKACSSDHSDPPRPLFSATGLKGSAANVLVPDTTGHLQRSCVHASTNQSCFGAMRGIYATLAVLMFWLILWKEAGWNNVSSPWSEFLKLLCIISQLCDYVHIALFL